jgi:hypothetical protein
MNFHSTFSRHIILNQTTLLAFFWGLDGIHHRDEDCCGYDRVLNVLCRTERNQHEGDETENLTVEEGLEVLGNLDRVTSEETLVQDDEGEEDGLSFNDSFSWGTDWSKEAIEFGHL